MRSQRSVEPVWCSPWPKPAQMHLLQVIFGPDERAPEEYSRWISAVDLDTGLDFGSYRLLPMLDLRLRQLGITDGSTGRLRGIYRRAWLDNSLLFARAGEVLHRLGEAGIDTMLLKGARLALVHYPSHECRPMSDIDLLVHDADVARAEQVIEAAGWGRLVPRKSPMERLLRHATSFGNGQHEIDLHWRPLYDARRKAVAQWFWQDALPMELGGFATLRPRSTALLLNVVIHGVRDNLASPIRWLADAITILRNDADAIDWDGMLAFAIRERIGWRLGLGLNYLRQHFATPIPRDVPAQLFASGQGIFERAETITHLPSAHPSSGARRLFSRITRKGLRALALLDHWK
jgi:hypothetical protein